MLTISTSPKTSSTTSTSMHCGQYGFNYFESTTISATSTKLLSVSGSKPLKWSLRFEKITWRWGKNWLTCHKPLACMARPQHIIAFCAKLKFSLAHSLLASRVCWLRVLHPQPAEKEWFAKIRQLPRLRQYWSVPKFCPQSNSGTYMYLHRRCEASIK